MSGPRLHDVAARAGVSMKTVSNVINDFPHVTEATRRRVLAAIDELGYQPNLSARNLAQGRAGVIALAIPELDMPYFAELSRYVIEAAERHSWIVLVEQTLYRGEYEESLLAGEFSRRIDGLIFNPVVTGASELSAGRRATPLVLLGERIYDASVDHVSIDNVAAARLATEHLVSLGRRRIAAIGTNPPHADASGTPHQRQEGYRQALRAAGLPVDQQLMYPASHYHGELGAAAMEQLLALPEPPDAVFCFTDWLALGASQTLHRSGYRVPDDVALIGFDDIPYGRVATPALSTIAPDKRQIAETAVELLAQRVGQRQNQGRQGGDHHDEDFREVRIDFGLVVRESTLGAAR